MGVGFSGHSGVQEVNVASVANKELRSINYPGCCNFPTQHFLLLVVENKLFWMLKKYFAHKFFPSSFNDIMTQLQEFT